MLNSSTTSFDIQVYHSSENSAQKKTIALEKKIKKFLEDEQSKMKKKGYTMEFTINPK